MFPKNKVSIIYRLLCLVCYVGIILVTSSITTLVVLFIAYILFALSEKSFRNIEFVVITLVLLGISYLINGYWLFRIMLLIDYIVYFIDTSYYDTREIKTSKNDYLRFKSEKEKKGSTNITALYLTVHLVVLFLALLVG